MNNKEINYIKYQLIKEKYNLPFSYTKFLEIVDDLKERLKIPEKEEYFIAYLNECIYMGDEFSKGIIEQDSGNIIYIGSITNGEIELISI